MEGASCTRPIRPSHLTPCHPTDNSWYRSTDDQTGFDLWVLPLTGGGKPFPVARTKFDEREGQFSPDGQWIAYQSNETERNEIYTYSHSPGPAPLTRVSTDGGTQIRWRGDGGELYYIGLDAKLMAVSIRLGARGDAVDAGTPAALFQTRIASGAALNPRRQQYAVSADGQRFLINSSLQDAVTPANHPPPELEASGEKMTVRPRFAALIAEFTPLP